MSWFRRRGPGIVSLRGVAIDPGPGGNRAGEYRPLYKYLRDRFADRVVMTFREIEDLLGFSLPDLARSRCEWWGGGDTGGDRSAQWHSWTLTGRTATVNLPAQVVVFERHPSLYAEPAKA